MNMNINMDMDIDMDTDKNTMNLDMNMYRICTEARMVFILICYNLLNFHV